LRSPLEFSRVTSGFNLKRFHPVLKKPRPHYGVDFGAPIGTPVRAVGDGVVEMADRNGGHGNYVKLDHEGPYSSSYSHLSSISVRRGAKVRQGEIVGFVGKTGLATGPHLHFQFWVDGRYVNPLDVELPQSEALQGEELVRFQAQRDALLAQLEQGAQEQNAAVADAVEEQKDTAAQ
jgi:murein DD-endopeptidase MepM/ murein hydrolase activator NlpD